MAPLLLPLALCAASLLGAAADGTAASAAVPQALSAASEAAMLASEDAVCGAGDMECALSLRQLRASAVAPAVPGQHTLAPGGSLAGPAGEAPAQAAYLGVQATSLADTLQTKSHVLTLYHQTSESIGPLILGNGFKPGREGWCGGAIYFATTADQTYNKAVGTASHWGFVIEAKVDVGRVCRMKPACDVYMDAPKLQAMNCDSIVFNPGDGVEWVIYDPARVLSLKRIASKMPASLKLPPGFKPPVDG